MIVEIGHFALLLACARRAGADGGAGHGAPHRRDARLMAVGGPAALAQFGLLIDQLSWR